MSSFSMKSEHHHDPHRSEEQAVKLPCVKLGGVNTELGEGLLWDAPRRRLLMTDILKGRLLDMDIESLAYRSWQFDEPLAWVLKTTQSGVYLLGLGSGIAVFDTGQSQRLKWINRDFPQQAACRLNDACIDAHGKLWYGSMNKDHPSSKDGQLASFSMRDGVHFHDNHFTVTNGPVVSADGQSLYFNDTLEGTIYRYRICPDRARLSDRQVFARFESTFGFPDGMCLDTAGHLWVALWGAASIVQLDTQGSVLRRVAVPAKNVTNVCFAGPRLDRLVVSTAAIDMSPQEIQLHPSAGALFEVLNHGCTGLPTHSMKLDSPWT